MSAAEEQKLFKFNVGHGKASIDATDLINTSSIPLANGIEVDVNGKTQVCGYYSHSSLNTYKACAKKFEYQYMLKEKPRLLPSTRMWAGSAVHEATERLFRAKNEGKLPTAAAYVDDVVATLSMRVAEYQTDFHRNVTEKRDPAPLTFGDKVAGLAEFLVPFRYAAQAYYPIAQKTTVVDIEAMFIYDLPVHSGGTIPIVGFIDAIEKDERGLLIVDHKVTADKKDMEDAQTNQQLTLYSLATGIARTALNNFAVGRSFKNPKVEILKLETSQNTQKYDILQEDMNAVLKGIQAGSFPRSGLGNVMVCSETQCGFYKKCLGLT